MNVELTLVNLTNILIGKPMQKRLRKGLGVGGRILLQWILKKWVSVLGIGLIWLRIGSIGEYL